jgi:hypothetical protein
MAPGTTPASTAKHTSRSAQTNAELTFAADHPMGADQFHLSRREARIAISEGNAPFEVGDSIFFDRRRARIKGASPRASSRASSPSSTYSATRVPNPLEAPNDTSAPCSRCGAVMHTGWSGPMKRPTGPRPRTPPARKTTILRSQSLTEVELQKGWNAPFSSWTASTDWEPTFSSRRERQGQPWVQSLTRPSWSEPREVRRPLSGPFLRSAFLCDLGVNLGIRRVLARGGEGQGGRVRRQRYAEQVCA